MIKQKKPDIGVIGVGFVGGAVKSYFLKKGHKVFEYDKFKKLGSISEVNRAKIVFIAVPTPYNIRKGFDLSATIEALSLLSGNKIAVLKSTVVPGTTDAMQKKFPNLKLVFNPEFLREATAYEDFTHPDRQVVGFTKKSKKVCKEILELLPKSAAQMIMTAKEAETVKYMANSFLALKVVFANEFFELCNKIGLNYNTVIEAVGHDKRITHSHLNVQHGGYRGYGGRCFPKDVNSIINFAEESGVKMSLLKAMRNINRQFLKLSGISEKHFLTIDKKRK